MDVLHAFEKACGKKLPYVIEARRPGDIAECYADPFQGQAGAWLGGRVRHRGYVRRQLELAEEQPPTATTP